VVVAGGEPAPARPRQRRALGPIDLLTGQLIAGWLAQRDHGPPASALLAVRAARRALQENPDDAVAHLLLGQAYLRLIARDRRAQCARNSPRGRAREAQVAAALNQALRLQPGLAGRS